MKTIRQVAELSGVSVRTLHYYDEIGLLAPAAVTGAGYRRYDAAALARLQQILFFRELDFPLADIRRILDDPAFDRRKAMAGHRSLTAKAGTAAAIDRPGGWHPRRQYNRQCDERRNESGFRSV